MREARHDEQYGAFFRESNRARRQHSSARTKRQKRLTPFHTIREFISVKTIPDNRTMPDGR
jgi:hypothetical protein